ncbi:hypothetical protein R3W88_014223 [Solanum pinnatisectum]|uniref:Uncharacterized protein n=1 Tax=Solanum pinnatisectum TaxID=50273 RepID=A0AAV9KQZ5_9SOLN|nr:hypothetical protein R3W88_014223 [Solanum pinnatisectum]
MDLVMMGFHEYIIDNLLLKDETDLSFTVGDNIKKFYYGLLLLVISLVDPLAQCSGFAIEAESVNSNKSNLVLQFLTVAFKLIESELLIYVLEHKVTANKIAKIIKRISIKKIGLLLSEIKSVKVEVRKVCFQFLDASPYIMTDGESLIDFLLKCQDGLLNYDACSIPFQKNQIPEIKDKLVYLGSFIAAIVQHRDIHQELKDFVKRVQDIMFVCLFPIRDSAPSWYYRLHLYDVRQLLKFVEKEVKMICLKVPDSSSYSFPKINELGFLDCFLGKLDEMLSSKLESVIDLKRQIEPLKEGLLCLRTLTDHFPEIYDEHDEVYSLITRVTAMAYKVLWISEAAENIKLLNKVVRETCERKKIDVAVLKVRKTSTHLVLSLSANTPGSNEEMESFQETMDQM